MGTQASGASNKLKGARSRQLGRKSAPIAPQIVQTILELNESTGTSAGDVPASRIPS